MSATTSVGFDTTVTAIGNDTGLVVPDGVISRLDAGKRPAVMVSLNGYEYRSTVGVMGRKCMISISSAVRRATALTGADPIHVELTVAGSPRDVQVQTDFEDALSAELQAKEFFGKLSNSLQRYHVDNINGAKTDETRQRRIERAVALFLEGKQR
jgi:GrpB-like predicted nucleotidyltransferase (UPF0157 family)